MSGRLLLAVGTTVLSLAAVAGLALGLVGASAFTSAGHGATTEPSRPMELFTDVLERVQSDYVEEVSRADLVRSAIDGMLSDLDPHSAYLGSQDFEEMRIQTEGEYGGLGLHITRQHGLVEVISPIEGTPADQADLEPGDIITEIAGESVRELSLAEAADRMRGEPGTNVALTVRRGDGDPFQVTLTRDKITIDPVKSRLEDKIGYLRLRTFNENTAAGLKDAVERFESQMGTGPIGYVLDLRNNPGGLLNQAVAVADHFLTEGEIVSVRGRSDDADQSFAAEPGDISGGAPLVVLVNAGSASGSEIVAGALQDHGRAVVMGTRTFGKGSVQSVVPLPDAGALRLTTAFYYTPSGRSIQARGIIPDIRVRQAEIKPVKRDVTREADLPGALRVESDNADGGADGEGTARSDYQLARAMDVLQAIALYRREVSP